MNNFWSWCIFGKCLPNKLKNFLPIFIETLRLYSGVNHIILRFLFLMLFVTLDVFCCFWNVILCLNSLSFNGLVYKSLDLSNVVLSVDKVLIPLEILSGRFLIIIERWFRRILICNGLLSGLLKGWYLPVFRFRVTSTPSRKLAGFNFVAQVTWKWKPSLKIFSYSVSYPMYYIYGWQNNNKKVASKIDLILAY